ncbi:MAG: hypothetical protein H6713_30380 [Myxococcales bacterium]|nr:hypothetical protein [Myxococcales bacterium]MCB9754273.1 hypothetical protein [Myxococcales bacterium]
MNNYRILPHEARVNVTWRGQNGDLLEPVPYDASDREIKEWVAEALAGDSVAGIRTRGRVDLQNFVVDRFPAGVNAPHNRIFLRPKTPFG